jgi:hypothetical protein
LNETGQDSARFHWKTEKLEGERLGIGIRWNLSNSRRFHQNPVQSN